MKKYAGILQRVSRLEEKYGIHYAKPEGMLCKYLTFISGAAWIYILFMNLVYILGVCLNLKMGLADFSYIANSFITICICTGGMIVGAALFLCKQKIIGSAVTIVSLPMMIISYSHLMVDIDGLWGYNYSFYWRHAAPAAILAVILIWLLVVLIRAKIKTDKLYNKVVNDLYAQYRTKDGAQLDDAQWEEFLKNFNIYSND